MTRTDRVFQLVGSCNNYPWGKQGAESLAVRLHKKSDKQFEIKNDEFYSELWFGDYPDFPARVLETGELLQDVLQKHKETLLGKKVIEELGGQLPFLPKILSIAKALPLQIHPNKELAAKLHAKDPENFTDPNHKPEIAVALSKFEVFAGWKPLEEVQALFQRLDVLQQFVPTGMKSWSELTLREVTRSLLQADEKTVKSVEEALANASKEQLGTQEYILDLLPRLRDQYGATDPGSLVALLCMNFLVLGAGDAIYIPADGIHAYLSGDIVECMARSNNVLNAGFCPPADRNNINMFADTLTFQPSTRSKDDVILPAQDQGKVKIYKPPMSEFNMLRINLIQGEGEDLDEHQGPGVMIVTHGNGTMLADGKTFRLEEGSIFFLAPGVKVRIDSPGGLEAHMAVVV
ncbi:RmlC-like cupin domain-containing protein [Triangularia verruculosa]|uniref:Mannose-6-phosphate isomerase n=1 Tax=Triangularia verruculosa TaxID=2587418 RepID=A0AAN7AZE2_9PEZI|nr:RmlC-like cupin domain-containing protein [Triangularia verruculosa]